MNRLRNADTVRSTLRDSHQHPGRFELRCPRCGLRVDDLTYADVCRRQDQHEAQHATADIGLPQ